MRPHFKHLKDGVLFNFFEPDTNGTISYVGLVRGSPSKSINQSIHSSRKQVLAGLAILSAKHSTEDAEAVALQLQCRSEEVVGCARKMTAELLDAVMRS